MNHKISSLFIPYLIVLSVPFITLLLTNYLVEVPLEKSRNKFK
ncbi:hypothetical protein HNP21_006370 [Bacillus aryabhattai]|uniref:Uncharacterized protein n=1 Tax=Priestia aryabhattai TaxID=412384 RepID=A0A7W3NHM3_PRIAR|nr:hypothetical protein [Priestia aryabhattai]MDP9580445.1 hypothetical protein [Bacillus sp. 1751]MDP9726863.1 hypothetical protein [Priestia aryabhattai]QLK09561.1 hypothetical protein BMG_6337 [Priestia megaterium]